MLFDPVSGPRFPRGFHARLGGNYIGSANLNIGVTQSQTISSVTLSNNSFTGGAASGTVVGRDQRHDVARSAGVFRNLSLSGTNASRFQIVGSNLETNGVVPAGTYQSTL